MLWSLAKVILFLAASAVLALLGLRLADLGGELRIWFFDHEFTLSPLVAVLALLLLVLGVWLALKLAGLLIATFRFLNGDETALSRHFDRNRERRGHEALNEGLIALASGEASTALARVRKAEKLLQDPHFTTLLKAQAAEAAGEGEVAREAWKELLADKGTRFAAIRGLLRKKLADGDTDAALKLAKNAFALRPRHAETQDVLLKLQADHADWQGARATLAEKRHSGSLPRDLHRRRDALLATQEAQALLEDADASDDPVVKVRARDLVYEANRLSPDLVPAAVMAARALIAQNDPRAAAKVVKRAWHATPHPELAAAFADIVPDEPAAARLKRFRPLLALHPEAAETRLTRAGLLLAAGDADGAKEALGDLPQTHPTRRPLALLAAAERARGTPENEVRAILRRAIDAPRGPRWCCRNCGTALEGWRAFCPSCGGFDTLAWQDPDAAHGRPADAHRLPGTGPDLAAVILESAGGRPAPVIEDLREED